VIIGSIDVRYGLLFFLVYIVMLIVIYFINKGTLYWRAKRIKTEELVSKQLVRMIMHKQEVLQSIKISGELSIILSQHQQLDAIAMKVNNYVWSMFNFPLLVLYVIIVLVLFYSVNAMRDGTFRFADFVVATTMIGYLMSSITHSVEVFKNLTKNFSHIEKIWQFFDNSPIMHGYNTGKKFIYNTGDIVLDGISFAYTAESPVLSDFSCHLV
jgi:ABC-type multidrug transport system fused ATPase/permease subunit